MTISSGIDELGRHAHALAIASNRSFHDCLHAELACNLRERKAACFELIHRLMRNHVDAARLGQAGDELIGHSVGEELLLRIFR